MLGVCWDSENSSWGTDPCSGYTEGGHWAQIPQHVFVGDRFMDKEANFPNSLFRWGNQNGTEQKHVLSSGKVPNSFLGP